MDPTTLLIVGATYVAAQVGRKVGDAVAAAFWGKVKEAWAKVFTGDPLPTAVTPASVSSIAKAAPSLVGALQQLMRDSPVLRRLERVHDVVNGARVLWIDDHPEWNSWEIACLEAAGAQIRTVETTRAALALAGDGFDVIISDIDRGGNPTEGLTALPLLRKAAPIAPLVFYVGQLQSTCVPLGAFGITNRPDEMLHLVMDVLERSRS
jgi:CheY-like chemotaxis protein